MSVILLSCLSALMLAPVPKDYIWWAPPHEYLKDHAIVEKDGVYHLFSICGTAGQDWLLPWRNGNEERFLHATSKDLRTWQVEGYVLRPGDTGSPDASKIWAPHIIKHESTYYMFYTGVTHEKEEGWSDHVETICLATSTDLTNWTKHTANPVFRAPEWAEHTTAPIACRDPMVMRDDEGKRWIMYYTALVRKDDKLQSAVGVAVSTDLLKWDDVGCIVTDERNGSTESCFVTKRSGKYYLFMNDRLSVSDDPITGWSEPKPYAGRPAGFAGEILEHKGHQLRTAIGKDDKHFHITVTKIMWRTDNCSFEPYAL